MFGKQITLFRLFGFRVGMDWSGLILITWTLAVRCPWGACLSVLDERLACDV